MTTSPLHGGIAIDEAIERHLAAFDATVPAVRQAAWAVAALVMTLSPSQALQILGFAHMVATHKENAL